MNRRAIALLLALLPLLAACGFQLRDEAGLPPEMAQTEIVVEDADSLLVRRVRTLLEQNGVRIVSGQDATAILEIPTNEPVTSVLTIGDTARVQEYRVSHTVQFRLLDAGGREMLSLQTLSQSREISFDDQRILAASREDEYLRRDLAEDLARMLVSRLESVSAEAN